MKNYQLGKIYKVVCNVTGLVYIGSTCEPTLARRLAGHVGNYRSFLKGKTNYTSSFKIIENSCYDIILVEKYPCNSKDELYARERYWTSQIDCVNQLKNQGLQLELGLKEYKKQYYEVNKDTFKEYNKQYRENNKNVLTEYHNQYYKANKNAINEYQKHKHACKCGGSYTTVHKAKHLRSQIHQDYVDNQSIPVNAIPIKEGSSVFTWESLV